MRFFFLWSYLKDDVYRAKLKTVNELKEAIHIQIVSISTAVRANGINGYLNRLRYLIASEGSYFEKLFIVTRIKTMNFNV